MAGPGLYANIHAKRERGGKMRKKGAKGAPTAANFKRAAQTARKGMKKGGFPDLSGDGKTTMKDILIGRGVIKKEGGSKMRTGKMGGGMMKKRMKRGGMAKKKRVKKAMGGVMAGIKALKKKMAQKKGGTMGGGKDASTMKPGGPKKRTPKMGGGIMKKRMKRGGRAMKRGGGMMKRPMMKRGGKAK
jgi:hypothetical protein